MAAPSFVSQFVALVYLAAALVPCAPPVELAGSSGGHETAAHGAAPAAHHPAGPAHAPLDSAHAHAGHSTAHAAAPHPSHHSDAGSESGSHPIWTIPCPCGCDDAPSSARSGRLGPVLPSAFDAELSVHPPVPGVLRPVWPGPASLSLPDPVPIAA